MTINGNRCPHCGNFMHTAFADDISGDMVYQCRSVGVPYTVRYAGATIRAQTLDHSDFFFVRRAWGWERVRPVRLGEGHSKTLLTRKGYPFERDEVTNRIIVPTCWTTARFVQEKQKHGKRTA